MESQVAAVEQHLDFHGVAPAKPRLRLMIKNPGVPLKGSIRVPLRAPLRDL